MPLPSKLPSGLSRQPRRAHDLSFPETLMVWALRHSLADHKPQVEPSARIAPEFSRTFSLARSGLRQSIAMI